MSHDIKSILDRLALVEGKTVPVSPKGSMTKQQERVPQLPALFKPKNISTTLTKKPYQKHPMDGYMVGENALAEAMQEVEEDMLSKVKKDLRSYLDQLDDKLSGSDDGRREKETPELDKLTAKEKKDRDLIQKAVDAVEQGQLEESDDFEMTDAEVTTDPIQLECGPVEVVQIDDTTLLEIHGDEQQGFEIRNGGRSLPTRFPNIDHAKMAVDIFKSRKKQTQDLSQDYIEEK